MQLHFAVAALESAKLHMDEGLAEKQ